MIKTRLTVVNKSFFLYLFHTHYLLHMHLNLDEQKSIKISSME